jgi:hypothetical protein
MTHEFTIHVYRPNGWLLTKISATCRNAQVAKSRAIKAMQKEGRLAHFYSYVVVSSKSI